MMSVKAERPLKDAIEARNLAAPKKSNAGAMDPKARTARTATKAEFPSKFQSKFQSGMGRGSKNPAASATGDEKPLYKGQEGQFPEQVSGGERRGQQGGDLQDGHVRGRREAAGGPSSPAERSRSTG